MFVATANSLSTINSALLDRMEIIDVSGYILEEKAEIARRHLIPKQIKEHGLKASQIKIADDAIDLIIESYTKESGVRGLDKQIAKVVRQIAKKVAMNEKYSKTVKAANLSNLLGYPKFLKDKYIGNEYAGVVTGLAWTSVGGVILYIETSLSHGKGNLTLTGNLGDVMKESATIALEFIKAHADLLDIDSKIFENWNIHMHVPEGAIPKDGPSAGITMAVSMASAITQRKVRKNIAMTGEITLRGHVLPVGGVKEKILAAKRVGITDIIICEQNERDIKEINDVYLKGLNFHYVENIMDVLEIALLKQKVKNPRKIVA
jgi:ATP-dependent Lon protease